MGLLIFIFFFVLSEVLLPHFFDEFALMGGGAREEEMEKGRRGADGWMDDMLREGDVISVV